jgi:hypothetical protein
MVFAAFAALAADGHRGEFRSEIVLPAQRIDLRFDHGKHLALGAQCVLCHASVPSSTTALDRHIPDHATCAICHRMEREDGGALYPKSACTTCHEGFADGAPTQLDPRFMPLPGAPSPGSLVLPPARLAFPHATHVDEGIPCLDCHVGIDKATVGTRDHLPNMYDCLECHDGRKAPDGCTTCHLQDPSGRVETSFPGSPPLKPGGRFRPDDHGDPEWLRLHEHGARTEPRSCDACHEPRECLVCHDGVQKPPIHGSDFVMTHGLLAQRRDPQCSACHEASFCTDCHDAAKVRPGAFPSPLAEPPGTGRFHPEGWAGAIGTIAGPEHHSHQARRALDTCTTCHEQDDCVACHAAVNPHGERFTDAPSAWRYGAGDAPVCAECHGPSDPNRRP